MVSTGVFYSGHKNKKSRTELGATITNYNLMKINDMQTNQLKVMFVSHKYWKMRKLAFK